MKDERRSFWATLSWRNFAGGFVGGSLGILAFARLPLEWLGISWMTSWHAMIIGVLLGVTFGFFFRELALSTSWLAKRLFVNRPVTMTWFDKLMSVTARFIRLVFTSGFGLISLARWVKADVVNQFKFARFWFGFLAVLAGIGLLITIESSVVGSSNIFGRWPGDETVAALIILGEFFYYVFGLAFLAIGIAFSMTYDYDQDDNDRQSEQTKKKQAGFRVAALEYQKTPAKYGFRVVILSLIFMGSIAVALLGSCVYFVVLGPAYLIFAMVLLALAAVAKLLLLALTKTSHLFCLAVTLLVVYFFARQFEVSLSSNSWLWLVMLASGLSSGGGAMMLSKLIKYLVGRVGWLQHIRQQRLGKLASWLYQSVWQPVVSFYNRALEAFAESVDQLAA